MQDESFLSDRQVQAGTPDASGEVPHFSLESGHRVVRHEEENFLFRLSAMEAELKNWLSQDEGAMGEEAGGRQREGEWRDTEADKNLATLQKAGSRHQANHDRGHRRHKAFFFCLLLTPT